MFYQPFNRTHHSSNQRFPSPQQRNTPSNSLYHSRSVPQGNFYMRQQPYQTNCKPNDIIYTDLNAMSAQNVHENNAKLLPARNYRPPAQFSSPSKGISTATTVDNSVEKSQKELSSPKEVEVAASKEKILKQLVKSCTEKTKEVVSKYESLEKIYSSNFSKIESELGITKEQLVKAKAENVKLTEVIKEKDSEIGTLKKNLNMKESQVSLYKTRMFKLLEINEKLNGCLEKSVETLEPKK